MVPREAQSSCAFLYPVNVQPACRDEYILKRHVSCQAVKKRTVKVLQESHTGRRKAGPARLRTFLSREYIQPSTDSDGSMAGESIFHWGLVSYAYPPSIYSLTSLRTLRINWRSHWILCPSFQCGHTEQIFFSPFFFNYVFSCFHCRLKTELCFLGLRL